MSEQEEDLLTKLNKETARLNWKELEPHFARGSVIRVSKGVDLIAVAKVIAEDNTSSLEQWIQQDEVNNASVEEAKVWADNQSDFWAVVVAPYVIVQETERKLDS